MPPPNNAIQLKDSLRFTTGLCPANSPQSGQASGYINGVSVVGAGWFGSCLAMSGRWSRAHVVALSGYSLPQYEQVFIARGMMAARGESGKFRSCEFWSLGVGKAREDGPSGRRRPSVFFAPPSILYPLRSLEESVYIRRFRVEGADRPLLLQDAVQCLFRRSGAGLGFRDNPFELGFNEVLSREDAGLVARGNALDGGGDAFVPGHARQILKSKIWRASLRVKEFRSGRGGKAPSVQDPSSREDPRGFLINMPP